MIAYRNNSWFPMPKQLGETFTSLSHPALKLYLALTLREKGRVKKVTIANQELMKAADIPRVMTFRKARAELISAGLIQDVTATDGSKRIYNYIIVDPIISRREETGNPAAMAAAATEKTFIRWMPREELHAILSQPPSLEGKPPSHIRRKRQKSGIQKG